MSEGYKGWTTYDAIREMASEEDCLEFCNKIRELGGVDAIPEFFPSQAGDVNYCVLARGLNFGCTVEPIGNMSDTVVAEARYQFKKDGTWLYDTEVDLDEYTRADEKRLMSAIAVVAGCEFEPWTVSFNLIEETVAKIGRELQLHQLPGLLEQSLVLPDRIAACAYAFDESSAGPASTTWVAKYLERGP